MASTTARSEEEPERVRYSIDIDRVESVLLVDGWHHALARTFDIREFTFTRVVDEETDQVEQVHDAGLGFGFSEMDNITGDVRRIAGPMSAILAVKYTRRADDAVQGDVYIGKTY